MQAIPRVALMLGLFNLGGGGAILVLALLLILLGVKKLPDLAKGLGRGIFEFRKAIDEESSEAGRSVAGIYAKPTAQALTPDNQVAELYEPGVFQKESHRLHRCMGWHKRFAKGFQGTYRRVRMMLHRLLAKWRQERSQH